MIDLHQKWTADLAIRGAGLACWVAAWLVAHDLYQRVHAHSIRPATGRELGLCAILVISVLAGNALLLVGSRLWKQVEIPGSRPYDPSETRRLRQLLDTGP